MENIIKFVTELQQPHKIHRPDAETDLFYISF